MEIASSRCSINKNLSWFWRNSEAPRCSRIQCIQYNLAEHSLKMGYQKLVKPQQVFFGKLPVSHSRWRTHPVPVAVEGFTSVQSEDNHGDEDGSDAPEEELLSQPLSSEELRALLADSERTKLTKKLSEANQQNRFLKRQLYMKEDALVNFKSELAVIELEIQALVKLAKEIAKSGIPEGSRKINGRYIQSHLHSRLEAIHEKLKEQIKDVDAAQSKEVAVEWRGMAESVQVMGSFDGWSQGEHLSPEYTGSYTRFSTTLMLRPGRYEIKFLVDGEWQLSSEFPTTGEGLMKNNLLIVE